MLMDITAPAELLHVEQADFGGGRKQAYLTFFNESDHEILGITGLFSLLDGGRNVIEKRRLTFDDLSAAPGKSFTCHLALDGYPDFAEAEMIVEGVLFSGGEPWEMNPNRLIDATVPELPEGPERVALIALAGTDAVCFPQRQELFWVCVCGRHNRLRWLTCHRCKRLRDETLDSFAEENVLSAHSRHVSEARVRDREKLREEAAKQAAVRRQAMEMEAKRAHAAQVRAALLRVIVLLLVAAIAFFGVSAFLRKNTGLHDDLPSPTLGAPTRPPVDFLEPI